MREVIQFQEMNRYVPIFRLHRVVIEGFINEKGPTNRQKMNHLNQRNEID